MSHETNTFFIARWSVVSQVSQWTWLAQLSDRQCLILGHCFFPNPFQLAVTSHLVLYLQVLTSSIPCGWSLLVLHGTWLTYWNPLSCVEIVICLLPWSPFSVAVENSFATLCDSVQCIWWILNIQSARYLRKFREKVKKVLSNRFHCTL